MASSTTRTRSAFVTGGTRGIGLGIATALARSGYAVCITGRGGSSVVSGREALVAAVPGADVSAVAVDVTDPESVARALAEFAAYAGGIDVVCPNAGIFPQTALAELSEDEFRSVLDTNVVGTFSTIKAAVPYLKESRAGRVIMTSSITGSLTGFTGWSHYGASKAAQLGMMRTLAIELAPWNITVNAVLPGNIMTEGLSDLGQDYIDSMAQAVPLGRLGLPEEIGAAVAFFASPEAGYVTGQTIIVDGGQTLPESSEALSLAREIAQEYLVDVSR